MEPNNPVIQHSTNSILSCEHMTVDVQQLLISGESEAVEFKQSLGEMKEILETIGAFANGEGGTIIIGLTPAKKVVGVQLGKDTLEAIINATCHRDYFDSGNIQVRIFDDRIEVWSPGLLPEGITLADLYRTHNSRPRNHRIAHAFFLINYIEQWGTGNAANDRIVPRSGDTGT